MNGNDVIRKIDRLNEEIWDNSTNDPTLYLEKGLKAFDLSEKENYDIGRAESLLNIGRCRVHLSELEQSRKDLETALNLFRTNSEKRAELGEMRTLNTLGNNAYYSSDFESALNYYFMAMTQSDISRNEDIRIRTMNNIGEIHRIINNVEEALGYYHQANSLAASVTDPFLMSVTSVNLGAIYLKINDLTVAEEHFRKALVIAEEHKLVQINADAMLGLGRVDLKNEKYPEAGKKIDKALGLYEKLSDKGGIAECSYYTGLIHLSLNEPEKAGLYIGSAETFAEEIKNDDLLRRCYRRRSQIEKALGNNGKALEYYERFYAMESDQRNDSLKNRLKKITIIYETEQTETEKESYRMQSLDLEKANKEMQFINEMGREITSSLELEEIVYNAYRKLSELLDINVFGIALYAEEDRSLNFKYFIDEGERVEPFSIGMDNQGSIAVWSVKNRKPAFIRRREDSKQYVEKWQASSDKKAESAIFFPLLHRDKLKGCMSIQSLNANAYNEHHLDILGAISSFIGIALDNSNVHHELNKMNAIITMEKQGLETAYRKIAHMANHDPLTDLPNRHLLNELLERGIKIANREKSRLAVLYMDLDKFKPINDTLGHETGDLVLRIVGDRLCSVLRNSDTVARIGGDEFVAVLYKAETYDGIMSAADKIIAAVGKDLNLKEQKFNLGISIGIAVYPEDGNEIEDLLRKSDNAMYIAKNTGKNRAVFSNRQPLKDSER